MNPKNINEQFEDAVFSMLMADVAEAEGKRLLEVNKQLQGDPEAAVPEEVSSRCLKAIKREFSRRNLRNIRRTCAKVFQRVAIVVLVVVACFSTMFVTSEAFRVEVMNYVIEIFDEKIDLGLEDEYNSTLSGSITANYIPTGYSLIDTGSNNREAWYNYQSTYNSESFINISVVSQDQDTLFEIDTEDAIVESLSINGVTAIYTQKDNTSQIAWLNIDELVSVTIFAVNVDRDELVKVAENITF